MEKERKFVTYAVTLCLLAFLFSSAVCGILLLLNSCSDIQSEMFESYENVRTIAIYSSIGGAMCVPALLFIRKYMPYER